MRGTYDQPQEGKWGNRKVALKMLECGMAQGYGQAAFELGVTTNGDNKSEGDDYGRSLEALHSAVKFGNAKAADFVAASFWAGDPLVGRAVDTIRAERYSALGDALARNPDLRLPNLDRVLPLPPAQLPQWDGKPDSLIDAAKGVRLAPQPVTTSAHRLPPQDRAHIPPGHTLQVPARMASLTRRSLAGFTAPMEDNTRPPGLAYAPLAGYWQARVDPPHPYDDHYLTHLRRDLADLPPMRFREGERMLLTLPGTTLPHNEMAHRLVRWHFMGVAVPQTLPKDWLAQAGTVRAIAAVTRTTCASGQPCPQSGIWQPYALDKTHPLARLLDTALFSEGWKWQAFVQRGDRMPSLQAKGLPIEDEQVNWCLMQACDAGFEAKAKV